MKRKTPSASQDERIFGGPGEAPASAGPPQGGALFMGGFREHEAPSGPRQTPAKIRVGGVSHPQKSPNGRDFCGAVLI